MGRSSGLVLTFTLISAASLATGYPLHAQQPAAPTETPPAAAPTAAAAPDVYPLDAVATPSGAVVVVDRNLPGLWQWKDGNLSILAQGSRRFREPLNAARSVAVNAQGQVLVGDSSTREIYRVDEAGQLQPLTGGQIGIPMDIAVRADGSLVVADLELRTLLSVSADGKQVQEIAKVNPRGVFVDAKDQIWVVSQDPQQLQVIGADGKPRAVVGKRTFDFPHQVVVNSRGEAFVSDGYKKAVWKVVEGSEPQIVVSGAPLDNPVGLGIVDDQVFVTDPRTATIYRLVDDQRLEVWFTIQR
jgi:DNA-binding beta-propeller fold protein YncE